MSRLRTAALALAALLPLASCSGAEGDEARLTVLAAASFTEAFEELARDFEQQHPAVEVGFSFGSSTTLAEQAGQGAPGDVLATADATAMAVAVDAGVLGAAPAPFATNEVVLAVRPGNPHGVRGPADLAGLVWLRCADEVPCGRATRPLLTDATAAGRPASLEVDVKAVLAKVASGEADAGFVYATDVVAASGAVTVVPLPAGAQAGVTAMVAPLADADQPGLAGDWIRLLRSDRGRTVLSDAGFGPA